MKNKIKLIAYLFLVYILTLKNGCDEETFYEGNPPPPPPNESNAVILTSTDEGVNWTVQQVNVDELNDITTTSNGTVIAVGSSIEHSLPYGVIIRDTNGSGQWVHWATNTGVLDISTVVDLGNQTAIALGPETGSPGVEKIYITTTDGWLWDGVADISGLNRVHFYNPLTGISVGNLGQIYRSIDGGYKWSQVKSPTVSDLFDVSFYTQTGFAVGTVGRVIKTTDGGENWTQLNNIPVQSTLRGVTFAGNYTNVIAVGSGNTLIRSSNGGDNWTRLETGLTNQSLNDVAYYYAGALLIASGSAGTILRSTNLGLAWTQISGVTSKNLNRIYFDDNGKCYIVGD